jgi:hypothetical protein
MEERSELVGSGIRRQDCSALSHMMVACLEWRFYEAADFVKTRWKIISFILDPF